ncbi:glycosyltransferase [Fibrobacter sp.]|uniref:glycosyltransferase n=1 Tax=Fibrobacter sp. TaxID=35828 RepID=UPI00386B5E65
MKVVQINQFSYKAAGNIMMNLHKSMTAQGIDSYVVWGRGREAAGNHEFKMSSFLDVSFHGIYSRCFDRAGFASSKATKKLIAWLDNIKPDIIHLHCLHGYYLNIQILFDYIRKEKIRLIWTQHDCWAFTGHCAYFDAIKCEKWKTGCFACPQLNTYPKAFIDNSKRNWLEKRNIFSGLNIQIVSPSKWLKQIIQQSFLGQYPINVIYNGIDLNVFKKVDSYDVRHELGLGEKKVILGVASEWTERKGLKDFIALDKIIDHSEYQILLVGVTEKQKKLLPKSILSINRTENVQILVKIYSLAKVFFNPTYEDNFPTTNLESIACETPVITYNTGGSPESINESGCGYVIEKGDVMSAYNKIMQYSKETFSFGNKQIFSVQTMMAKYGAMYVL